MKKVNRKVNNKRPQSKKGREVDEEDSDEDEDHVEDLVDMELLKQEMEEAIKHMQIELTKNVTLRPSTGEVSFLCVSEHHFGTIQALFFRDAPS